jgi:cell division protein FtsL
LFRFYGKWLKVKKAIAPELIMWANLGIGKLGRFFRILIISFITLILICATFYVIILAKNYELQAE